MIGGGHRPLDRRRILREQRGWAKAVQKAVNRIHRPCIGGADYDEVFDVESPFPGYLWQTSVRGQICCSISKIIASEKPSVFINGSGMNASSGSVAEITWVPRIIAKARAKLRGELPPDLMCSRGADRPFLRRMGIHPADFLRLVWEAGEDDQYILRRVEEWEVRVPVMTPSGLLGRTPSETLAGQARYQRSSSN